MIIKGDVDGDGKINGKDARIIQAIMLSGVVPEGEAFIAADINNDNEVDIGDLGGLRAHILGVKIINEVIY